MTLILDFLLMMSDWLCSYWIYCRISNLIVRLTQLQLPLLCTHTFVTQFDLLRQKYQVRIIFTPLHWTQGIFFSVTIATPSTKSIVRPIAFGICVTCYRQKLTVWPGESILCKITFFGGHESVLHDFGRPWAPNGWQQRSTSGLPLKTWGYDGEN